MRLLWTGLALALGLALTGAAASAQLHPSPPGLAGAPKASPDQLKGTPSGARDQTPAGRGPGQRCQPPHCRAHTIAPPGNHDNDFGGGGVLLDNPPPSRGPNSMTPAQRSDCYANCMSGQGVNLAQACHASCYGGD